MDIAFNSIKYHHDSNGSINLIFIPGQSSRALFFDGASFEYRDNLFVDACQEWESIKLEGEIVAIKQTEDYDIIIKLINNSFLKIYFFPDNSYPNSVVQTITFLDEASPGYYNLDEDFKFNSSDVEF